MERKTIGKKQYMLMATSENSKSNPSPRKVFENLHDSKKQARFKGNHKVQGKEKSLDELEPNA